MGELGSGRGEDVAGIFAGHFALAQAKQVAAGFAPVRAALAEPEQAPARSHLYLVAHGWRLLRRLDFVHFEHAGLLI